LDTWYRFVFEDGSHFDYSADEKKMEEQIALINHKDVVGYRNLLKFTKKIFDKGYSELSDVPFDKPSFMFKQIPALLSLKSYKSVYSLVSGFIENEKLRRLFSMHPLLVGGNPFTTTSIYGLILYLEKKWGIHYSMGGTGQIIKGFEKLMLEEDVTIIKGKEVKNLLTENKRVVGVVTSEDEEIKADNVVCNADPPGVYSKMLNNQKYNTLFNWKINRMEYSMGLFVYYFGTKKKF